MATSRISVLPIPPSTVFAGTPPVRPTTADSKTEEGAASATGAFTSSMTDLSPNTPYYVRAYATNTADTVYGDTVTFTTDSQAATVTTQAVTDIGTTTATGNGNITILGIPEPTQHGVCWNTTGTPTTADSKTEEGAASATGAFTSSITGLSPNTPYYVRAYATNTADTVYGNEVTFTTLSDTDCPECSEDPVVLTNVTFPTGTNCECSATTSITFESDVTVETGATVTFIAPLIVTKSVAKIKNGAMVIMRQPQ